LVGCQRRGEKVRISVIDTGIGIPTSKQKLIFREFKRLSDETSGGGNVGLGLSIVDRIARLLEHPIELASATDAGSRFTLSAPLSEAPRARRAAAPPTMRPRFYGMAVLAVDNEPQILEALSQLLNGWGVRLVTAKSWNEARGALQQLDRLPDMALIDFHLDDASGLDLLRQLQDEYGPMPAALITAERGEALRLEAERLGIPLLPKPLKAAALRALLAHAESRRTAAE
jgi:CheY-like chemotaxis protein